MYMTRGVCETAMFVMHGAFQVRACMPVGMMVVGAVPRASFVEEVLLAMF
jgi:hypothetical protein